MSSDERLDRVLSDLLDEGTPSRVPDRLEPETLRALRDVHRMPRWLALIRENPMRTNSQVTVGSPTVRVAVVMAATLLLTLTLVGAGLAGARLLAADGTIVVAQDGSGTVETIVEAVAMAEDGDTILVRPGTYVETVTIDKDITLRGDGARDEIIIEAPDDGPTVSHGSYPYALNLVDTDAEVSGLTFRGPRSAVVAEGGSPLLEALHFEGVGVPFEGVLRPDAGVVLSQETTARFRANTLTDGGVLRVLDGSDVVIEDNTLTGGPYIQGTFGGETIVRGNRVIEPSRNCVTFLGPTTALVEGNTCQVADKEEAIFFVRSGPGNAPVIRGNEIRGAWVGISVPTGAAPVIEDNLLEDNEIGIALPSSDARVAGNVLRGGRVGISITGQGSPTVVNNTVEGAALRGIVISGLASPTLVENNLCGSTENLVIQGEAEPVLEGNDICPDAPPEPAE